MNIEAQKIKLASYILKTKNESLLQRIKSIVDGEEAEIITHKISGEALNIDDYRHEIENAELEIKKGNVLDHQEVKEAVSKW